MIYFALLLKNFAFLKKYPSFSVILPVVLNFSFLVETIVPIYFSAIAETLNNIKIKNKNTNFFTISYSPQ
jgi:hypothetical protein